MRSRRPRDPRATACGGHAVAASFALLALLCPLLASAESVDDVRVLASADAPPTARALAARRLGATSPREREPALRALLSALEHPFPVVRSEAASALGRLGDERAMPRLERRVGVEEDEGALAALLLAIGEVGARYAVPAVLPRCDDSR